MTNKDLKRRIIEISHKYNLSHLGSCLTAVDIIDEIYSIKKPNDRFILSSGHAGLALYVVLEKYYNFIDAEDLFNKHGVHPNRDVLNMIDCSTGSLGQGLPIAVGMALADRKKNVYCLISDGECSEGSIWEALRIKQEQKLDNLKVYINFNSWGAYKWISESEIRGKIDAFSNWMDEIKTQTISWKKTNLNYFLFLQGQDAHYHVMSEEDYGQAMEILK